MGKILKRKRPSNYSAVATWCESQQLIIIYYVLSFSVFRLVVKFIKIFARSFRLGRSFVNSLVHGSWLFFGRGILLMNYLDFETVGSVRFLSLENIRITVDKRYNMRLLVSKNEKNQYSHSLRHVTALKHVGRYKNKNKSWI